jgi:hypothetical protein
MSGGGHPRTQFRLAHSHRRSFEWTARIGSPFFGFIPWAAISFLAGALVSRIGCIAVGKVSGADPKRCSPRGANAVCVGADGLRTSQIAEVNTFGYGVSRITRSICE